EAHRGALGAPAPLTVDGHLNRLVTRLPEAGGDRSGRAQRHLVLARRPATDHRDPHGVTVDGGLVPAAIVTVSARCPREPDGGNSEITKPIWLGSVVVCSVTAGTKPAFFRADTAAFRVWPTTSGTVIAPVEAKIVTWEPRFTRLPAPGLWLSTLPCGSVESLCTSVPDSPALVRAVRAARSSRPTTLGTATVLAPREISRLTGCRVESCVPAGGEVPITALRGTDFEYCWTTFTWKPTVC